MSSFKKQENGHDYQVLPLKFMPLIPKMAIAVLGVHYEPLNSN